MTTREPIYIEINNSIVDLSQITTVQRIIAPVGISPRILFYIGKEVAFTFQFNTNEDAEDAYGNIIGALNDALEGDNNYVVDCNPNAGENDEEEDSNTQ